MAWHFWGLAIGIYSLYALTERQLTKIEKRLLDMHNLLWELKNRR